MSAVFAGILFCIKFKEVHLVKARRQWLIEHIYNAKCQKAYRDRKDRQADRPVFECTANTKQEKGWMSLENNFQEHVADMLLFVHHRQKQLEKYQKPIKESQSRSDKENLGKGHHRNKPIQRASRIEYDVKTLSAIGRLRRGKQPCRIENCIAIVATQDTNLCRCMHDLYPNQFPPEISFAINTAATPFKMSKISTIAAPFFPTVLSIFVVPAFLLPFSLKSKPASFLLNITEKLMLPIK